MNNPKKFNAEKAIEEMLHTTRPGKLYLKDVKLIFVYLTEHIPASEAHWTGIEKVQRINKFLEEDKQC